MAGLTRELRAALESGIDRAPLLAEALDDSKTCEECGGLFHRGSRRSHAEFQKTRFCRLPCAITWQTSQPGVKAPDVTKQCRQCGGDFTRRTANETHRTFMARDFCSPACGHASLRKPKPASARKAKAQPRKSTTKPAPAPEPKPVRPPWRPAGWGPVPVVRSPAQVSS